MKIARCKILLLSRVTLAGYIIFLISFFKLIKIYILLFANSASAPALERAETHNDGSEGADRWDIAVFSGMIAIPHFANEP